MPVPRNVSFDHMIVSAVPRIYLWVPGNNYEDPRKVRVKCDRSWTVRWHYPLRGQRWNCNLLWNELLRSICLLNLRYGLIQRLQQLERSKNKLLNCQTQHMIT